MIKDVLIFWYCLWNNLCINILILVYWSIMLVLLRNILLSNVLCLLVYWSIMHFVCQQ